MRARKSQIVTTMAVTLTAVGVILCMPIWLPISVVLEVLYKKQLRAAAESTTCATCGRILGHAALNRADEEWIAKLQELKRLHPGSKFRLVRTVRAICAVCGTRYRYLEKERKFVLAEGEHLHLL